MTQTETVFRRAVGAIWRFATKERKVLLHTGIGTFAGAFLGAWLAILQADCSAHSAALKKLEMVRREAEGNFDTAVRIREMSNVTADKRSAVFERLDLSMVRAAMIDERVVERLPTETLSLLVTYIRDGELSIELQNRYNTLAVEWAVVSPGNVAPGLKEAGELLRYNASVFAAESFVVGEELAKYVDVAKFNSSAFKSAREVLERRVREVTQGIVDGKYERVPRMPRVEPTK